MPKIYLKSKDVRGVEVIKYDGVCYTRTGITSPASRVTLTPTTSVTPFYVDCDGCLLGEQTLAKNTTLSLPNTADEIQIKFDTNTPDDTATIELTDPNGTLSTCAVTLSVNASNNLVFDALASGNGPWEFTTVPMTINYVDCNTMKYDITLAGLGSYIITLSNTGSGGSITQGSPDTDTVEMTTTFEDIDVSELDATAQSKLITAQEAAIADQLTADGYTSSDYQLTTTIESGSVKLKTMIKFINSVFDAAKAAVIAAGADSGATGILARLATKIAAMLTDTTVISKLTDPSKVSNTSKAGDNSTNLPSNTPSGDGGTTTPTTSGGTTTTNATSWTFEHDSYPITDSNDSQFASYWALSGNIVNTSGETFGQVMNFPSQAIHDIDATNGSNNGVGLTFSVAIVGGPNPGDVVCFQPVAMVSDWHEIDEPFYKVVDLSLVYANAGYCHNAT